MCKSIYVIETVSLDIIPTRKISSEAYEKLGDAYEFIIHRADKPNKYSDYIFKSSENCYLIHELYVK